MSTFSLCSKCGGKLKLEDNKVVGGVEVCHERTPKEDHEFITVVQDPPKVESESAYYNRRYGELMDDSYGHWTVVCRACPNFAIRGKHSDFGGDFNAHLRACHPYPHR